MSAKGDPVRRRTRRTRNVRADAALWERGLKEEILQIRNRSDDERAERRQAMWSEMQAAPPYEPTWLRREKLTDDALLSACERWQDLFIERGKGNFDPLTEPVPTDLDEMTEVLVNAMEERGLDADGLASYIRDGRDSRKAGHAVEKLQRFLQRKIAERLNAGLEAAKGGAIPEGTSSYAKIKAMPDKLTTLKELAALCGKSERTVRRWCVGSVLKKCPELKTVTEKDRWRGLQVRLHKVADAFHKAGHLK